MPKSYTACSATEWGSSSNNAVISESAHLWGIIAVGGASADTIVVKNGLGITLLQVPVGANAFVQVLPAIPIAFQSGITVTTSGNASYTVLYR